jgi:hypothetical protein
MAATLPGPIRNPNSGLNYNSPGTGENNGVSVQHPVKVDELSFAT